MVVEPKLETTDVDASGFREGLTPIKVREKWGYINTKGDFVIKPQFSGAGSFSEGLAPVFFTENGRNRIKYINKNAQVVFVLDAGKVIAGRFSEGLARFTLEGKYAFGFINKKGVTVIPPKFRYTEDFSEGLARVSLYREGPPGMVPYVSSGYVNNQGDFVIKPRFEARTSESFAQGNFLSGLAIVCIPKKKEYCSDAYINKKGITIFQ
jgi:WG containing repeat